VEKEREEKGKEEEGSRDDGEKKRRNLWENPGPSLGPGPLAQVEGEAISGQRMEPPRG